MVSSPNVEPEGHKRSWVATMAALALIVAAGLFVRVYRMDAESFWWDEYSSLTHLDADSLTDFLARNRTLDPATLPLYYSLEYLWWHGVGADPANLRWLSVLIGLAAIPLAYATGRAIFGQTAGLVAAACVALSPLHAFHAQGIRMYVLMDVLALCSLYTFIKLLEGRQGRWWWFHAASNILLLWTHPFAALFVAVEGLYLVAFDPRPGRRTVAWIAMNAFLAAPTAIYLATVRFWPAQETGGWFAVPSLPRFLADIIADDVIGMTYQLRVSERAWASLPAMLTARPTFDIALLALFCAALGWAIRQARRDWARGASEDVERPASPAVLLVLWLVLPPLVLYAASKVWRPCIFPRYTLPASLALYLMIGGMTVRLGSDWSKAILVACCVLLLGYQNSLRYPGPQRTDWRSAATMIRTEASPDDLVLVQGNLWRDIFEFHMKSSSHPIVSAESLAVLGDLAAFHFLRQPPSAAVWAVVKAPYFDAGPSKDFEACLTGHGLAWRLTEFEGIEHILVYRLSRRAAPPPYAPMTPPGDATEDYVEGFGNLAMALAEHGRFEEAQEALDDLLDAEPGAVRTYAILGEALARRNDIENTTAAIRALRRGYGYRHNGNFGFAADEFRKAAELAPTYALAHLELGITLAELGDLEGAASALKQAVAAHSGDVLLYTHLIRVIEAGGNVAGAIEAARLAIEAIQRIGAGDVPSADTLLERALQADPDYVVPYVVSGLRQLAEGDEPGMMAAMQKASEVDPELVGPWQPLLIALFETHDVETARAEAACLEAAGVFVPEEFLERIEPESKEPDPEAPNR